MYLGFSTWHGSARGAGPVGYCAGLRAQVTLPRLHGLGLGRHQDIRAPAAALGAPEPQLDHRHITAPLVDQLLQVRVCRVVTGPAPDAQPQEPRREHGPRRR
jgi:hypothetical protein